MIRHIVIWKIKDTTKKEDMLFLKEESKKLNEIDCVVSLDFIVNPLNTSSHDMMLDAIYNSVEDLEKYRVHPIHVEFGKKLRPLVSERVSYDYEF